MEVYPRSLPNRFQRRTLIVAISGLAIVFGVLIADVSHQITRHRYSGYFAVNGASSDLSRGINPYAGNRSRFSYVYPPLYAFLYMPLLRVSIQAASRWVMLLDASFVLLAMLLASKLMLTRLGLEASHARIALVSLVSSLIIIVPIRNELRGLESDAPVLLCFVLALYWVDRRPVLAGVALALAINIKYLPVVLLPYLLLRRRWTTAMATVIGTAILAILPALLIGWTTNLHYVETAAAGLLHLTGSSSSTDQVARVPMLTQSSSLSITSGIARLGSTRSWASPSAGIVVLVIALSWAGVVLGIYRLRGFNAIQWPAASRQGSMPFWSLFAIEWCGMIAAILALGPNTQDRHMLLAAFPAVLATTLGCCTISLRPPIALIIGTAILAMGVTLPVDSMGSAFTIAWRSTGAPGWFVLVGSGFILWWAFGHAARENLTARMAGRIIDAPLAPSLMR